MMPARVRREPELLLLRFERDGSEPETKLARGGRQALLYAVGLLIGHTRLMVGDKLSVRAAGEAEAEAD
jgi:hypothetical protein